MAVGIDLPNLPPLNLLQVNTGLQPDDGLGDTWFVAFSKHNTNMEILANFAAEVNSRLTTLETLHGELSNLIDQLRAELIHLQTALAELPEPPDLTNIYAQLEAIDIRLGRIPQTTYVEAPLVMLGFGRPDGTIKALGYATGIPVSPYNTKAISFLGVPEIRVMMMNMEWNIAGQDERVNTNSEVVWNIYFSHLVRAASVLDLTFVNVYEPAEDRATVGAQIKEAIDPLGNVIAQWSSTTNYAKGAVVSSHADILHDTARWFVSRTDNNLGNPLPTSNQNDHWTELETAKRWARYRVRAVCSSPGGEKFVKLAFPSDAVIPANLDGTGKRAILPCEDRGLITVVAA